MKFSSCCLFIILILNLTACSTTWNMQVKKTSDLDLQILKSSDQKPIRIYSVLALKPSVTKRTNLLPDDIREKSFFINMIEDFLLVNGYAVITNDFLINVRSKLTSGIDPSTMRNSEFAMLIDPRFVDAVIKINSLRIDVNEAAIYIDEDESIQLNNKQQIALKIENAEKMSLEAGSDYCLYKIPYYEFEWSLELVHIASGRILSKSYQKSSSLSQMPEDYQAEFSYEDSSTCKKIRENFSPDAYTSPDLLKNALTRFIQKALVRLFEDYPPMPGKNTATDMIEKTRKKQIPEPSEVTVQQTEAKKDSSDKPIPTTHPEEKPSDAREVSTQSAASGAEAAAEKTIEKSEEVDQTASRQEENLIEALKNW